MRFKIFLSGVVFFIIFSIYANVQLNVTFPENQNCVAYKTNKSMIFEDSVDVVGLNCNITMSKKNENGSTVVSVTIPLNQFDSGEKGRDKYVFDFLQGKVRPDLLFTSKPYSSSEIQKMLSGSSNTLSGSLAIGDKTFPVEFKLTRNNNIVTGQMNTTFTYFNLEPPTVGPFGMVAGVKDVLDLHFQVIADSI